MADPKVCCAPLISLSPGPRSRTHKHGGAHWGKLQESMIEPSGRPRSVSGNHLARTCCPIEIDPCCRWGFESTKARSRGGRGQARVWIQMQNSFAAGCGGGCVRAERKRECESDKCERACLRSAFFRSVMVPFEQQQQQNRVNYCIGRTGLAARKVIVLARAQGA